MVSVLQSVLSSPWVFCDTETTGLTPAKHRVWEICLSRFEVVDGKRIQTAHLSTLLNPAIQLDEDYHFRRPEGVTGEQLRAAPKWRDQAPLIEALCKGALFFAHNAPFDIRFIESEQGFVRRPSPIEAVVCTQQLAKKLLPGRKSYALEQLKYGLGLRAEGEQHRAEHDTRIMTALFVDHLLPVLGDVKVYEVVRFTGMDKHSPALSEAA